MIQRPIRILLRARPAHLLERSLAPLAPDPECVFAAFHPYRQERYCARKGLDSGILLDAGRPVPSGGVLCTAMASGAYLAK
ncbi:hypothetical protein ACT3UD_01770 [Glutamicibacter sp. 287]|uniref:hypothetical protein n=1 Tax=unclassified Glutamicibacter TaxID=2627139 RepID=UPI001142A46E|nr:hypothetical protein [Glutamicibacter sp. BW80]